MLIAVTSTVLCFSKTDSLRNDIENFLKTKKANVGVAIMDLDNGDTLTVGNEIHYPMQSTYKFHLALAILDKVDKVLLSLDQKILLTRKELKENTWSPMRDKYPKGNVELTISEILKFTISQSDNNGCDILFKLIGGTKIVNDYIHSLGIKDVAIAATEVEMDRAWKIQFKNWTYPLTTVQLFDVFFNKKILSKSSFNFLWTALVNTTTGPDRLKGLLPKGAVVAHKTGSSGFDDLKGTAAFNDIGIIELPNGKHIAIAVYITKSFEEDDVNAKIIATIAKLTWDYYLK